MIGNNIKMYLLDKHGWLDYNINYLQEYVWKGSNTLEPQRQKSTETTEALVIHRWKRGWWIIDCVRAADCRLYKADLCCVGYWLDICCAAAGHRYTSNWERISFCKDNSVNPACKETGRETVPIIRDKQKQLGVIFSLQGRGCGQSTVHSFHKS